MAIEIERKFLVANDEWRSAPTRGRHLRQAYLASSKTNSIRVRVIDNSRAWLTIKSGYRGITRDEFQYEIPVADAVAMFELRQHGIVEKTRYQVPYAGLTWEVDVFAGDNQGLIIAEIELDNEAQSFTPPPWLGSEITGELRYQNSQLTIEPYTSWAPSNACASAQSDVTI